MLCHQSHAKDTKINLKTPNMQRSHADVVAFTAMLSTERTIPERTTIIFDQEITNVGGMYNKTSGEFACTDDNLYALMWSLQKAPDVEGVRFISKLRKGDTDVKYGPKSSYFSTTYAGTTEMVAILQCTTSPPTAISVMTESWSDTHDAATFHREATSFSGFRLSHSKAFTVELSSDKNLPDGSRIMFDKVLSNFGGFYDVVNGRFLCSDNGIYVFSVSTQTTNPAFSWSVSRLMRHGSVVVQGPITYRATDEYDSGSSSISVVLHCNIGDSIYVEAQAAHDFPINSYAPTLTSFTGFKLYDATSDEVAFTAVMTNNQTDIEDPLRLDKVITNIGDYFDPTLWSFICPDDDYYLFTWNVAAIPGNSESGCCHVGLFMDSTKLQRIHLTRQTLDDITGTSGSCSISHVTQCVTGSKIYIKGDSALLYLGNYTMLTGYKIPKF